MGAPATSSRLLAALLLAAQLVVPPAATSTPNRPHRGHTGEPPPKCMGGCGKDGRPGPCCCPGCTPTGNMPGTECGPGRISSYGCNMGCGSFCCCPLVNATSCGKKCVSDRDCSAGSNCSTCELHPSPKGVVRACGGETSAVAAAGRGTGQSARPQLNGSSPRRGDEGTMPPARSANVGGGFGFPCDPGHTPPERCPDGRPCPPGGQCNSTAPNCFDVAIDHIIGEGDCGKPHVGLKCNGSHPALAGARNASECCDRCRATDHCACWTYKTNHESLCVLKNELQCLISTHRPEAQRISGRARPLNSNATSATPHAPSV